ncbi:MAG: PadR family transcriptional regulator [Planctomycetaceae bacterium]|nr:PadR family transcriptional regulator [Planctomycetaceae bacterium]
MPTETVSLPIDMADCPCAGGTLDKLIQPAILVILAEGPLHGYRLVERLGEMRMLAGHKPDASGVYRFLKGMEGRGLVNSAWDTSGSGPAKRVFQMTASGQSCLRVWITTLEAYRDGINSLLKAARKAAGQS